MQRVVIVGGGFGGLNAARSLRRAPVEVSLIDRHNYHLFQPLLYQVATGLLSPANIAAPLRALVARQRDTRVFLAEATGFDVAGRRVLLRDGSLAYDTLILAAGSSHSYFGHQEWEPLAPGLKTIDDATSIRRRVLEAFEVAERLDGSPQTREWLTFVIVGGGPTGVELAGALAEVARHTLRDEFRRINPGDANVIIVEANDRVLAQFAPELSAEAKESLVRLGVQVINNAMVTGITPESVSVKYKDGPTEQIRTRTVLWAAGVQASPLGRLIAEATGAQLDRAGRVHVKPDLTVPGHPEIFIVGDMAHYEQEPGKTLPALAPVAQQQGKYVAQLIRARLRGSSLPPFVYRDYGTMATIGRGKAVADLRGFRFAGAFAWLLWLFVHLLAIVQFQNRILVLIQWAWSYMTWNRSARLITGEQAVAEDARLLEAEPGTAPASEPAHPRW